MVNEELRRELISLREEDLRVRKELLDANLLGGPYHPRIEAVHVKNAARLRELIAVHGWPTQETAGADGCEAAWLIGQHAVGEPAFMRQALSLVRACAEEGSVPRWHAAYLEDRIALYEGRPQRFGSQWIDNPRDGVACPWTLADPEHVNELRASVGLTPLPAASPPGPDLPIEKQRENEAAREWWLNWLTERGWLRK